MSLFNKDKEHSERSNPLSHLPSDYVKMIRQQIGSNPDACNEDQIPQGYGKFGLEKTNPIPVYGIPSNEIYLDSLKLKDGGKFRWRRDGSIQVSNISHPIDKYEIFDVDGNTICFLYISPYHWKISKMAPEGFIFRD